MKKKFPKILLFVFSLSIFFFVLPISVWAEETYTITFRAGNARTFDVETLAFEAYENVEVNENYVKIQVEVKKGTTIGDALGLTNEELTAVIQSALSEDGNETYALRTLTCADTELIKNTDVVLDYSRIVNPVSYSISYVDATGNAIYPSVMAYGSEGEEITASPLTIAYYETEDTEKTIVLTAGETNAIVFTYTYTGTISNTEITNLIPIYIPGTTTYTTTVNTVIQDAGTTVTNVAGGGAANAQAGADVDDEEEEISDEETPLGGDGEGLLSNILGEETPLAALVEGNSVLVPAVIGVVAALVVVGLFFIQKKKSKYVQESK